MGTWYFDKHEYKRVSLKCTHITFSVLVNPRLDKYDHIIEVSCLCDLVTLDNCKYLI